MKEDTLRTKNNNLEILLNDEDNNKCLVYLDGVLLKNLISININKEIGTKTRVYIALYADCKSNIQNSGLNIYKRNKQ